MSLRQPGTSIFGLCSETDGRPDEHLDCGQVGDDLTEMAELLRRGPEDAASPWHDLRHVAGLLRTLAYLDLASDT